MKEKKKEASNKYRIGEMRNKETIEFQLDYIRRLC